MTTPASGALNTDFELMAAVAGKIDVRNDEVRAMLRAFIAQMTSVPTAYAALQRIAETMRQNERILREVADAHSHDITATTSTL